MIAHYIFIVMTERDFTQLALSFPGTETSKHFNRVGYRVKGKRMFATYLDENNTANIFLTLEEQKIFCKIDKGIYPVPNKWGEKGATTFELDTVPKEVVTEGLFSAYNEILKPKK